MQLALLGLEANEIRALLGSAEPEYRARQIYEGLYRQRLSGWDEFTSLPKKLRNDLALRVPWGMPAVVKRYDSIDGTCRYLLRLQDGKCVESVFMPEEGRDTLCISSQVGCPVDCKFCLTALMGLERNLTAGEIAGQVILLAKLHGLDPVGRQLNVVMMGQGEPLLNLANVVKATRILVDANGVGISERRITLSTSGIIPRIVDLSKEPVRPKLAISLNASNEMQRQALMPITRKWHLAELLETCRAYPLRPWEKLTFEYVLLGGVNDSGDDARRVVRMLSNLKAKVNLIPLNPGPGIQFSTPEPERVQSFKDIVSKHLPCFVRKPRGLDIFAACGQLQRIEQPRLVDFNERV
jgi:23S rRNA (adenine2503-C2)-methyltransferase